MDGRGGELTETLGFLGVLGEGADDRLRRREQSGGRGYAGHSGHASTVMRLQCRKNKSPFS